MSKKHRKPFRTILKVQLSIFTTRGGGGYNDSTMIVYDETRKFCYEGPTTPEIRKIMRGRNKAFFHAWLVPDGKGWQMQIEDEAEWQEW